MKKLTIKLLLVSFLVLPAMLSFAQDMSRLPDQNICLIKDYQPSAMESVNSIFTEDFSSGIFPPAGWTIVGDGQDNWSESATNNAGGEAPEAMLGWSPQFVGNTKLVTAEIATSGYSSVLFEMKHYVNDYAGSGYTLKVETTSDGGTTWNEVWSEAPAGAIGPETLQLLISNGDVGSDNFQVAFTLDGDSYQINYWYIDDIMLSEALANDAAVVSIDMPWLLATGTNLEPAATVNNQGSETATFDVTFEILDGATPIYSEVQTVTDLGAFEAASLTFPTWVAVTGNFVAEVTADLAGDENPENDMMTLDIEVVDGLVPLKPLYEMFTSATCAPCVPANENLTNILNANPDEYTLIKYQMNWPGSGDIYYTEEGGVRKDYYGVSWVPDLYIVGEQLDPAGSLTQEIFDEYLNELTALEIEITEAEIDEDLNITIAADLTPLADYAAGLTAHIVVVEKLTVGNVGSNGETEFYNVMHKMLPDAYGATLDALVTGQQVTLNQTFNMDETNMETPNDLAVVVFVQDDSDKSIVQSSMIDVDGTFAAYTATYTVQDEAENPIEGAEVFMEGNGTLITDALGEVVFEGVFPGNYEYAVEAAGFFPGNGEVTVIDQDIFETVTLVAPEFYWFEMFDVEPTDWTYHFTGWDYVYWYDGKMIIFRQSGTTEPLMLVSPAIDIDPANTIMFDLGEQGNAPAMVDFGTMTDPSDPSTFTLIETIEALPEWQTFEYDLSNLSNIETDVYFAWSLPGSDMCFFSIDNVILTEGGTSQYCDASTGNEDEYIGTVQCGDIDNTSGWQNGVADYTDLSTAIEIGGMLDITVLNGGGLYATDAVSLWVDWNDDFVFDVATEELVLDNDGTGAVFTGTISCPAGTMEGNHRMRIRMVYSAIPEPCGEASWGEVEDYTLTAGGGGITSDCEDFDDLTVGGYVAEQLGGLWTTWSGTPGTAEDALVSDMYSVSPSNSMLVEGSTDAFQLFSEATITSGKWVYENNIYIPTGTTGYWNLQKTVVAGEEWGFQIMYEDDMTMVIDAAGAAAAIIPYEYDTWYNNKVIIDIDNDLCQFYVDNSLIVEYQWTLGTFGTAGANTLGGANYFANPGAGGTPPGAHFDDICFNEYVEPDECEDFDALTVGGLVAEQLGGMWSTWSGTTADDATVTDAESNSPDNSFVVDAGTVDLIFMFDDEPISTGQWLYSHYMKVPSGMDGYFNVQTEPTPGVGWNIELTFAPDGTGVFAGGATGDFTYTMDEWFLVEINYDLSSGLAQILFDGAMVLEWENAETIGAIDYYGAGTNPMGYFDDVCFGMGWTIEPPALPAPCDLVGPDFVIAGEPIELSWTAPEDCAGGDMVELVQHDGVENNGWYQSYDNGYGVVYDLAAYPGATIEMIDFRHSSWGVTGTWDYKIRIVDWDTYTELAELGPFQTTGNDAWEQEVDLGSYAGASGLVGIFMEPMGNDPADAYPCIDFDAGLDGTSFYGPLADYSGMTINDGDFLMDLWIMTAGEKQLVKPAKVPVNSLVGNGIARNPSTPVIATELTVNQSENKGAKELTGYNVYRKFNTGSFQLIDYVIETMYVDEAPVPGVYTYYVTAVYDPEGESEGSNEWLVDLGFSVNEILSSSTELFPNPANNFVNITSTFTIENVRVYNFAGQAVLSETINNTTYRVNTSQFQSGVYLFQIDTKEGRITRRIVIE